MEDLGDPVDANKMVQRRPAAPLRRGAVLYGIRTVNLVGQGVDFIAFHSGPVLLILLRAPLVAASLVLAGVGRLSAY